MPSDKFIADLKAETLYDEHMVLHDVLGEHYKVKPLELFNFASNKNLQRFLKKQPRERLDKFKICYEDLKLDWIYIPMIIVFPGALQLLLISKIYIAFNSKSLPYYAIGKETIRRDNKKTELGYTEEKGEVIYQALSEPNPEERKVLKTYGRKAIILLVVATIIQIIMFSLLKFLYPLIKL